MRVAWPPVLLFLLLASTLLAEPRPEPVEDLFAIHLVAPVSIQDGTLRPHVRVFHPYDRRPLAGVEVTVSLDGSDTVAVATTDERGVAEVTLALPEDLSFGTVMALARHRGAEREAETMFFMHAGAPQVILGSDKRLYQPGQTLHVRGLWLTADGRPLAGEEVKLALEDPRGRPLAVADLVTSQFGIAATEWRIPPNAEEGDYTINGGFAPVRYGQVDVTVSRYEVPRFRIERAETSKPFYLKGEDAEVEVRLTTAAGEPVAGAEVRVEPGDSWYAEDEILTTAAGKPTGEDGRTIVRVPMAKAHAWLEEHEDHAEQFQDHELTVVARDAVSGRTVRAPLAIRVSRWPIHAYVVGQASRSFVTTSTADGTPVACDVEVRVLDDDGVEVRTARLATDRYGVGRFELGAPLEEAHLVVLARDGAGRIGRVELDRYVDSRPTIVVDTPRTVHRRGQPLEVTLRPSEPMDDVVVVVHRGGWQLRERRFDRLEASSPTRLVFAAGEDLEGYVAVVAYSLSPAYADGDPPSGRRTVLYPNERGFDLEITTQQERYRPGQRVRVDVRGSEPAVLGLAVTDRSLEALQELRGLGPQPGLLAHFERFAGWEEEYAGWTADRFLNLAPEDDVDEELDRLAELLVHGDDAYVPAELSTPIGEEIWDYQSYFEAQFLGWDGVLDRALDSRRHLPPADMSTFFEILAEAAPEADAAKLVDPWGTAYRASGRVVAGRWIFKLESAGRDAVWGSVDDFVVWTHTWPYARPLGRDVSRVLRDVYERTGSFPADAEALVRELTDAGIDWQAQRDPRGRAYRISLSRHQGRYYQFNLLNDGPDGTPDSPDDVIAWSDSVEPGDVLEDALGDALDDHWDLHPSFLATDEEVRSALRDAGWDPDSWRDVDGHAVFFEQTGQSDYSDLIIVTPDGRSRLEPRETKSTHYVLWSVGPDGRRGTGDDIRLGSVEAPTSGSWEELSAEGSSGSLRGRVYDPEDLPLPGVTLLVLDSQGSERAVAISDAEGRFAFVLPAGVYSVRAQLDGFTTVEYVKVEVLEGRGTGLDIVLEAAILETITVTSEAPAMQSPARTSTAPPPRRTPRIRRDFRETLLWLPELATGEDGHAEVDLDLDDSITTWRLAALASTRDGRIATATHEVVATLPFQVELDLPPVVTAGDEVAVPVYLHNRTESRGVEVRARRVDEATPANVSTVSLGAGDVRRLDLDERFDEAGTAVLAVTASGAGADDGVERSARVRPDGREVVDVHARLVAGVDELALEVPEHVLPGTGRLAVRWNRRLRDHLEAAVEALARRPVGCAEQTLSAAWANVVWWRTMEAGGAADAEKVERARRHVKLGRDALAHFRRRAGGIAYWSGGEPDVALTAYALEYLEEVGDLVPVDGELPRGLADWLSSSQYEDGAWRQRRPQWHARTEDGVGSPPDLRITAWVARVLAPTEHFEAARRGLAFLDKHRLANDRYTLANVVLAREALAATRGDARPIEEREELAALARELEGTLYWDLESNTPFHGWGRAGRVETTALAVRALHAGGGASAAVRQGAAFLLLHKDADGAWSSTQATVQALRALATVLPRDILPREGPAASVAASLDGVELSPDGGDEASIAAGAHRLRLESPEDASWSVVEARVSYYVPWPEVPEAASSELYLDVSCDPKDGAEVLRPITCAVEAGRRRFRGYGMLIAEIGLPPGADVDRASLDDAVTEGSVQSYEVWPDRVVTYLWPRPGGVRFSFVWRPRLALAARSAPSSLYDYYNPSSRIVLAPEDYRVVRGPS